MTERKQRENPSVRHEGRSLRLTKAHKRKTGEGEGKGALSNNLVYTKRQKDIYANRKHETTFCVNLPGSTGYSSSDTESKHLCSFMRRNLVIPRAS